MIQITSSGNSSLVFTPSSSSPPSTAIPLSVFGSIISKAPKESRKEKSGARTTCPIDNAADQSTCSVELITSSCREKFLSYVLSSFLDKAIVLFHTQSTDFCLLAQSFQLRTFCKMFVCLHTRRHRLDPLTNEETSFLLEKRERFQRSSLLMTPVP
jgi:hypothetical protein